MGTIYSGASPNPADWTNRIQTVFSKKLRESVEDELVLSKYAERIPFASNQGGHTLRVFRPRKSNTTGVNTITAGSGEVTTPATTTEVAIGYVDIALSLLQASATISNLVRVLDLFNTVQLYVEKMKEDCALNHDTVLRNAFITGANALNLDTNATVLARDKHVRFAGVANADTDAKAATRFASLHAATAANSLITRGRSLGMVTKLKNALVPKINGKYVAAIPYLLFTDLLLDADVRAAMQYSDTKQLWNGWMGQMDGVVFVENSNPFILSTTYDTTHVATGDKYAAIYLGREAIACPEMKGKLNYSDPRMPSLTVLAAPDKSDINNLVTKIGWKSFWGAATLYDATNSESSDVPHYGILWAKSTALAA